MCVQNDSVKLQRNETMTNSLKIGTKLKNEYGIWTIIEITNYDGSVWYDLRGDRGHVVAYPSQIGTQYKIIS